MHPDYIKWVREHRENVEAHIAKLVTDGHLISDMALREEVEHDGNVLRLVTTVIHRPSGRVLTSLN